MSNDSVPVEVVAEAGDILAEEVDVLLERLADKVLATPPAGSRAWHTQWNARNSPSGHHTKRQRLLVKIAIAYRAGIDPVHDVVRARQTGTPWITIGHAVGLSSRCARQRWDRPPPTKRQRDTGQLAIW